MSVSALVRDFLTRLAAGRVDGSTASESRVDVDELRRLRLREVLADIRVASGGFKAADNIPRDELHDRNQASAGHHPASPVLNERGRPQGSPLR